VESSHTVVSKVNNEAGRTQSLLQVLGKLLFIFDDQ